MHDICSSQRAAPLTVTTFTWPAPQLPLRYHLPAMLLKWAAMTAGGCLVDRQLLGSFWAGWPTYVLSLLVTVGASSAGVAWREARARRAFGQELARQEGLQRRLQQLLEGGGKGGGQGAVRQQRLARYQPVVITRTVAVKVS